MECRSSQSYVALPGGPGARLVLVQAPLLLGFLKHVLNPVSLPLLMQRPLLAHGRDRRRGVTAVVLDLRPVQFAGNEPVQGLRRLIAPPQRPMGSSMA